MGKLGVGLESGLVQMGDQCFDFCACSIFDGKQQHIGVSSMFPLPPKVAATLKEKGYSAAFEACGVEPNPNGAGVLGIMSGGRLSRPSQMQESVAMALLQ